MKGENVMNPSIQEALAQIPTWQSCLAVVCYVIGVIAYWKIFVKAGEAGWKAIIPILNAYTMYTLTFGNGWLVLLLLIPIVNFVVTILWCIQLAKSFGKGTGFAVGLIFLSLIFELILAFDSSKYLGSKKAREAGIQQVKA